MKPYRSRSLFRFRALRRMVYGRGHGVHSPLAFAIVRSVVRPWSGYYAEDEVMMDEDSLLLFRMLARMAPATLYHHSEEMLYPDLVSRANSCTEIIGSLEDGTHDSILYTDDAEVATRFAKSCRGTILLTGIRRSKARERAFKKFISQLSSGIAIDLFDAAIFVYIPDVMYLYRSTM